MLRLELIRCLRAGPVQLLCKWKLCWLDFDRPGVMQQSLLIGISHSHLHLIGHVMQQSNPYEFYVTFTFTLSQVIQLPQPPWYLFHPHKVSSVLLYGSPLVEETHGTSGQCVSFSLIDAGSIMLPAWFFFLFLFLFFSFLWLTRDAIRTFLPHRASDLALTLHTLSTHTVYTHTLQ